MIKLETRDLSYSYHAGQAVLSNISLGIDEGTITVLLGLNSTFKIHFLCAAKHIR